MTSATTVPLTDTLSLTPRLRLHLTLHRSDLSLSPLDTFSLKTSLSSFLLNSLSTSLLPEDDIRIYKHKDTNKRKRYDPIAVGEGKKFRLSVVGSGSDDFEGVKKEWEEYYAFGNRGNLRREKQQPDTLVLRGLPSRWFAETRVSSKPSMLVTHTILSAFGKIRNLSVAEDDDFRKNDDEDKLVSGLHCKIVVQYEKYSDFEAAMKALCGRSLQKEGSHLKADYEVSWEKDGFRNAKRNELFDRSTRTASLGGGSYRSEAPRRQSEFSRYSPDNFRSKRYRD